MRKREIVDDGGGLLRPPPQSNSNRSRPASAGSGLIGRASPYLGNANFASSSSSVNSLSRQTGEITTSSNAQQPQQSSNPNGVLEAPFLTTAESHLGRMTLTAPDNMLRRKQEEKEKRQKARKRKAERAEAAIMALYGTPESSNNRTISFNQISNPPSQSLTYTTEVLGTARRRPGLTTSRSSSNLPLTIDDQQRSRSPTRPQRPRSAQNTTRTDMSPERRASTSAAEGEIFNGNSENQSANPQNTITTTTARRVRRKKQKAEARTGTVSNEERTTGQNGSSSRGRIAGASSSRAGTARSAVRAEALRRATQRRRDIYADLSSMGLPGASDSEPEEGPPPFPGNATRPVSPPQLPAEGEEWTEEMRRKQEEYLTNKPPDSPPPAFRSDGEDDEPRTRIGLEVSDEESVDRDEIMISEERRLWEEDVAAGYTFEERLERERLRRNAKDILSDSMLNQSTTPIVLPNPDLGQAVREARARRSIPDEISANNSHLVEDEIATGSELQIQETLRKTAHRRTVSDGKDQNERAVTADKNATRNAAVGTGKGLAEDRQREIQNMHGKVTKIRPRPSSESHSRFRDDASEAAKRRLALWSSASRTVSSSSRPAQISRLQSQPTNRSSLDVERPTELQSVSSDALLEPSASILRPRNERKQTSSSSGGLDEGPESSDSEAEWAKEENQFKRMQEKSLRNSEAVIDSSDEDEQEADPMMPGALRSSKQRPQVDLPELGKIGSSVPRAPPPLVLGRSRGGAAYSSSSESSSESDGNALQDVDEDSNSDSPPEMEEASSENQFDRVANDHTVKSTSGFDKGKQPVRPLPSLPSTDSLDHNVASESDMNSVRAGTFEEDSASSRDFTDEEDGQNETDQTPTMQSFHADSNRPAVQNRLKDLFNARISPSEGMSGPSNSRNASRASFERLFDVPIDGNSDATTERNATFSNANRRPSDTSQKSVEVKRVQSHNTVSQKDDRSQYQNRLRAETNERKPSWSTTQRSSEGIGEQQARMEALYSISELQRRQDSLPAGVDRDSLAALERLLARTAPSVVRTPSSSSNNGLEPLTTEPTKLTRSGAIGNRQMSSSAFVNPRTINAPRPLGRLPTITDATRHFPPSHSQNVEEGSSRSSVSSSNRPASMIGTPSWMAYVPRQERQRLPEPIKPDIRLHEGIQENVSPTRNSRVLAMVERFEQNGAREMERENQRPPSPTKTQSSVRHQSSFPPTSQSNSQQQTSVQREDLLRRRPPPLPPLFSSTNQSNRSERVPSEEHSSIASTSTDTSAMTRALRSIVLERQRQLSDGSDSSSFASRNAPPLPPRSTHSPLLNESFRSSSGSFPQQQLQERRRSRPLPIPPALLPGINQTQTTNPVLPSRDEVSQPLVQSIDRTENAFEPMQEQQTTIHSSDEQIQNANVDEVEEVESPVSVQPIPQEDNANVDDNDEQRVRPRRETSFGITDLDIFASRLADERRNREGEGAERRDGGDDDHNSRSNGQEGERDTYDDLHLLAEFLGPAKAPGLTQNEMESLPVGVVEVLRRRIVGKRQDGRDKVKLALAVTGVKVERCAVCLIQFKEGNLACVFPCLHVLHEQCAAKLLRNTKQCPTCRAEVI